MKARYGDGREKQDFLETKSWLLKLMAGTYNKLYELFSPIMLYVEKRWGER